MKIVMLGTGNASATECYNSCFLLSQKNKYILVDGGGGSNIFKQLEKVGLNWKQINNECSEKSKFCVSKSSI